MQIILHFFTFFLHFFAIILRSPRYQPDIYNTIAKIIPDPRQDHPGSSPRSSRILAKIIPDPRQDPPTPCGVQTPAARPRFASPIGAPNVAEICYRLLAHTQYKPHHSRARGGAPSRRDPRRAALARAPMSRLLQPRRGAAPCANAIPASARIIRAHRGRVPRLVFSRRGPCRPPTGAPDVCRHPSGDHAACSQRCTKPRTNPPQKKPPDVHPTIFHT